MSAYMQHRADHSNPCNQDSYVESKTVVFGLKTLTHSQYPYNPNINFD